jgi:LacI family transcriptional regulator
VLRNAASALIKAPRHARLRDVAQEAGVSVTTASVVLGRVPNSGIPPATQERVRKAARQLGYVPNFSAQSLRTERSRTLGFIADRIASSPFAGEMIAGAQAAAWKDGYVLLIVDAGELEDLVRSAARVLLARRVEGIILAAWFHRPVHVLPALRSHRPVLANCFATDGDYAAIVPDEVGGGYLATRRLLQRQRGPVGFINLTTKIPASPKRLEGYKHALREAGVPYDRRLVVHSRTGEAHEAFRLADRMLEKHTDLRLLFCGNDRTAMGAFEAIKRRGLRIPEDVAVVGFDNQEIIARELMPGLTTVALPHYAMGERAVRRALEPARAEGHSSTGIELSPCVLVERQSV